MKAAIVTVGDELLAGDVDNSNATWLCRELTERGVDVNRVLVVPDYRSTIADVIDRYRAAYDAVVVTGGLGNTPDDVTMEGVADAFDRPLRPNDLARRAIDRRIERIRDRHPGFSVDKEAEAAIPADSRPLINHEGLSPGCVIGNVYVLPGIPSEMTAMFATVADEFSGAVQSRTLFTTTPEAHLIDPIETVHRRFDVSIGCYPDREAGYNTLKLTARDPDAIAAATRWLRETIGADDDPPA